MQQIKYTQKDYQEHLAREHKRTPLSEYLREIVYGGNDGIITTFAVVAGFTGAQSGGTTLISGSFLTVLLFGFANLFADGTSMALGNFLSTRSAQDVYQGEKDKELSEIKQTPQMERAETMHILQARGFSSQQADELTDIFATNQEYWTEFMMKYELEMENPLDSNPYLTGLATFISFICFGFIPLVPYLLIASSNVFFVSVSFTLIALLVLGLLRWKVTKESIWRSVGEIIFLGSLAAGIAYIVGTRFVI